jgi:hypothetical protein
VPIEAVTTTETIAVPEDLRVVESRMCCGQG